MGVTHKFDTKSAAKKFRDMKAKKGFVTSQRHNKTGKRKWAVEVSKKK